MKPSLETLAGLYTAALKQKAEASCALDRVLECIDRHGYTEEEVLREASRLAMRITAGDYAMRPEEIKPRTKAPMETETAKSYMAQRADLVARLIQLSEATTWNGYKAAAGDIKEEIARIDQIVNKPAPFVPNILGPQPWTMPAAFDPCEGCGPICGNTACPKRTQVTCGTKPDAEISASLSR